MCFSLFRMWGSSVPQVNTIEADVLLVIDNKVRKGHVYGIPSEEKGDVDIQLKMIDREDSVTWRLEGRNTFRFEDAIKRKDIEWAKLILYRGTNPISQIEVNDFVCLDALRCRCAFDIVPSGVDIELSSDKFPSGKAQIRLAVPIPSGVQIQLRTGKLVFRGQSTSEFPTIITLLPVIGIVTKGNLPQPTIAEIDFFQSTPSSSTSPIKVDWFSSLREGCVDSIKLNATIITPS